MGCLVTIAFWPKSAYKTQLEKAFRQLACNIRLLSLEEHRHLHATVQSPQKPSVLAMQKAVACHKRGDCRCNSPG